MSCRVEIEFVEVGPRDGLQNESKLVATSDKLELISRAINAGARRIEVERPDRGIERVATPIAKHSRAEVPKRPPLFRQVIDVKVTLGGGA